MLSLKNISKEFHRNPLNFLLKKNSKVKILNSISFNAMPGEIIAVIGRNGSGKTTLLKTISGLLSHDEGSLNYKNVDISNNLNNISLVNSNDRSFFWRLSIIENLKFFSRDNFIEKDVNKILELLDLNNKKSHIYLSLSSGEKKRLAIARALMQKPKILLLDEFTTSIDIILRQKLLKIIKNLSKDKILDIVIFTTHHLEEVMLLANKVMFLENGSLIQSRFIDSETTIEDLQLYF
tara:strand:- start:3896 stop:4603 length:708 start_codon:yes stop_codon:yes gene_type:complete